MKKVTYILGHKNPDTDSVVSAVALAELKTLQGYENVVPIRIGAANNQTEYIFKRFCMTLPVLISNLHPRAEFYMSENPVVITNDTPVWEAVKLDAIDNEVMPVVDSDGCYCSMLHYGVLTKSLLNKINPNVKSIIHTNVSSLVKTMQAQPICLFNEDETFNGIMSVAIMNSEAYKTYLEAEPADNKIAIIGDRPNIQKMAIASGVKVIIIVNGALPSKEVRQMAEDAKVSILVSSYDTSSTVSLVIYSAHVSTMSDSSIQSVRTTELMKSIKKPLMDNQCHAVAVVDKHNKVVGLLNESSFLKEPNIDLILVDHNELSQSIPGVEHYKIIEVVDHHHISTMTTTYPINFVNKVVGATCTIIANMYRESKMSLSKQMASILLCGILADTLCLRSVTTTDLDIETANYLSNITDLNIAELGQDIVEASSNITNKSASDIINGDKKEYDLDGLVVSVSQVEVTILTPMINIKDDLFKALDDLKKENDYFACFLLITDVTALSSVLLVCCDKDLSSYFPYNEIHKNIFELKDILSRKKQLMPMLFEIVDKVKA